MEESSRAASSSRVNYTQSTFKVSKLSNKSITNNKASSIFKKIVPNAVHNKFRSEENVKALKIFDQLRGEIKSNLKQLKGLEGQLNKCQESQKPVIRQQMNEVCIRIAHLKSQFNEMKGDINAQKKVMDSRSFKKVNKMIVRSEQSGQSFQESIYPEIKVAIGTLKKLKNSKSTLAPSSVPSKQIQEKITEQLKALNNLTTLLVPGGSNSKSDETLFALYQELSEVDIIDGSGSLVTISNAIANAMSREFVMQHVMNNVHANVNIVDREIEFTLSDRANCEISFDRKGDAVKTCGAIVQQSTEDGSCHAYSRSAADLKEGEYSGDYYQVTDWDNLRLVEVGDASSHSEETHNGSSKLQKLAPQITKRLLVDKKISSYEDIEKFAKDFIVTLQKEMCAGNQKIKACTWAGTFYFQMADKSIIQLNLHLGDARSVSVSKEGQVSNLEASNRKIKTNQNGGAFGEDNGSILSQMRDNTMSVGITITDYQRGSTVITGSDGQFDSFEPGLQAAELKGLPDRLRIAKNSDAYLALKAEEKLRSPSGMYDQFKSKMTKQLPTAFLDQHGNIVPTITWSNEDPTGFLDELHSLFVTDGMQKELNLFRGSMRCTPELLAEGFANLQNELAQQLSESDRKNLSDEKKQKIIAQYQSRCPKEDDHTFVVSQPPMHWQTEYRKPHEYKTVYNSGY